MSLTYTIHHADVLEALRAMDADSYSGCLTDPPYGLTTDGGKTGFMGHAWDKGVPPVEVWREVLRVLKPGAYLLAFGGTRTYHRLTCAIEDAGFEIRDSIAEFFDQDAATQAFLAGLSPAQRKDFDRAFVGSPIEAWCFGQGFPKSHNVSAAIDREAGAVREVVGAYRRPDGTGRKYDGWQAKEDTAAFGDYGTERVSTAPATEAARQWSGYGSATKPAFEPVIVARKPLVGTIAQNVQAHGCGALAIDACRVSTDWSDRSEAWKRSGHSAKPDAKKIAAPAGTGIQCHEMGRWPANVILSHSPECVEVGTREVVSRGGHGGIDPGKTRVSYSGGYKTEGGPTGVGETKAGTKYMRSEKVAAYECVDGCPVKALDGQSGALRNGGQNATSERGSKSVAHGGYTDGAPSRFAGDSGGASRFFYTAKASKAERNAGLSEPNGHPCLKPLALTRYLARLILPPVENTRLLSVFCGSGSEMIGALQAGWSHVEGIDSWDVAVKIARARLAHHEALLAKTEEPAEQLSLVGT